MSVETVLLGEIATIIAGQSPPGSTYNESGLGLPFFQGKADFGRIHPVARKWCVAPKKIAEAGDILISIRAPVGPTNIAGERCCIGRGLATIRPDETIALRDFVHWIIKHRESELVARGKGSTFAAIGRNDLDSFPIPLPSLDEQRQIVGILNRAARIEHLRSQANRHLREFASALFIKMFGDPVENPMAWSSCKMGNLGTLDRGRSKHRPRNAPHLYGGSYPFIQTGDIATSGGFITEYTQTYSEAGLDQSRIWPAGTLCITIAANIGMTGVLDFDACFPDSVVGFLPNNRVTVEYIQTGLDLMQNKIEEQAPQSAQRNINLKILRELEIPVASFRLQSLFAKCVTKMRDAVATAENTSKIASALNTSLMTRLLEDSA